MDSARAPGRWRLDGAPGSLPSTRRDAVDKDGWGWVSSRQSSELVRDVLRGLRTPGDGRDTEPREPVWRSSWRLPWHLSQSGRGREEEGDDDSVMAALMPLVWTLRLYLMLPVSISRSGGQRAFRFRWVSLVTALTFAAWCFVAMGTALLVWQRVGPVSDGTKHFHLWDVVPAYAVSIGMAYVVFMPLTCWATTPRAIAFLKQWKALEAEARVLLGPRRPAAAWVRRQVWAVTGMCVVLPVALEALASVVLPNYPLWAMPSSMHASAFLMLGISFWVLCCRTFAGMAAALAARMRPDFRRQGLAGLRAHRRVWLSMARTLVLMGESWGRTHLVLLGCTFVSFTSISFLFTHFIADGVWELNAIWLGIFWALSTAGVCGICNGAHLAVTQMRGPFIKQLLCISLSVKNDAVSTEIYSFLDDIRLKSPQISLGGLAVLSRSSILSIFALSITYLVVLSQFTISSESAAVNFSEVVSSPIDAVFDPDF